jgi:ATP-dependent RNA helicase DDX52/ROK1
MDIFKLLSRATKPTGKSSATGAKTSKLPSAGSTPNPQLYHDPIPEQKGRKRKRNDNLQIERAPSPVDEDFNFFAPKADRTSSTKRQAIEEDDQASEQEQAGNEQSDTQWRTKVLDESECRQILRSHRLKITLLPSGGLQKATSDKRKKTSKKQKAQDDARSKAKEEPKQLYPQPLLSFGELQSTYGISRRLRENLAREGYKIPTEVQMGSLPLLLRPDIALGASTDDTDTLLGDATINLLTVAPTGSGKTLAFLIPVVNSMIQRRREGESHRLEAIIIAPTRELASQIVNEGRKLALGTGIKVVKMQKGMKVVETGDKIDDSSSDINSSEEDEDDEGEAGKANKRSKGQSQQPTAKADILVTTPLALLHAISSVTSDTKTTLPTVRHLILDEADVLLDPLFREQTLGIWDACINPDLHVTLWSATMGSNIEALASSIIHSRQNRLGLQISAPIIRLVVGLKDSAIPNISHRLIYTATEPGKLLALRQLLHTSSSSSTSLRPPFLIFTQTIPRAVALHSELLYDIPQSAGGSSRLAVLHSDLSSTARSNIMTRFRAGDIWILITTDLLSRGVDFRGINGVVNYDIPNSAAAYIHRVGRTGRAGREGGVAVTFYTKEDIQYVKGVANVIAASEKQAGRSSDAAPESSQEAGGLPKWLLDALPTPSKNSKKKLKMHGVEARRTGLAKEKEKGAKKVGAGRMSMQISTKSGFERRLENRRRGAIEGSKRRKNLDVSEGGEAETGEWSGFEE